MNPGFNHPGNAEEASRLFGEMLAVKAKREAILAIIVDINKVGKGNEDILMDGIRRLHGIVVPEGIKRMEKSQEWDANEHF